MEAAIPDAAALVFACLGVVRAHHQHLNADETGTPLDILGGVVLWLLRLALAPASTLAGFRAWVLTSPVAPARRTPGLLAAQGQGPRRD